MIRKAIEALRKRAVSCGCTYTESGAYMRVRAVEVEAVCDVALQTFPDDEEQIELPLRSRTDE